MVGIDGKVKIISLLGVVGSVTRTAISESRSGHLF